MTSSPLYMETSLVSRMFKPPVNCGNGCKKYGLLKAVARPIVWTPLVVCCETARAARATLPPVGDAAKVGEMVVLFLNVVVPLASVVLPVKRTFVRYSFVEPARIALNV